MFWTIISAVAAVISTITYILTAIYIRDQLKGQRQDRYLHVTSDLFTNWQDHDFMEAQLWLVHRLQEKEWTSFIAKHRGDYGEIAFHRIGGFYDRVGTLVRLGFVNEQEILTTIGSHAIAVWNKIEPLVREARATENAELFRDFERMLPACHACYVPALSIGPPVAPFSLVPPAGNHTLDITTLKQRIDRSDLLTILDVRQAAHVDQDPRALPHAMHIPPDQIENRYAELPHDRDVIAYCTCPDERTSARVALYLRSRGYRAFALLGGFNAWRDARLPLVPLPHPAGDGRHDRDRLDPAGHP